MGLNIDEPRSDDVPFSIDRSLCDLGDGADRGNSLTLYRHVGAIRRASSPIDYRAVLDDDIVSHVASSSCTVSNPFGPCNRSVSEIVDGGYEGLKAGIDISFALPSVLFPKLYELISSLLCSYYEGGTRDGAR